MAEKQEATCDCISTNAGCCKVSAVVSVDERGQMVLPKEVREKAGIRAGDKLALASWETGGQIHCIVLIKADALADMVKAVIGPALKDIQQ